MRFMMFMIPDIYQGEEAGKLGDDFAPPKEAVAEMGKYNEELAKAGALISLDGLHPPTRGARVRFSNGERIVTDGPFAESKEVVGGYWMIKADSLAEAVEWAKRVPAQDGCMVEVRQVFEMCELPEEVRTAGYKPAEEQREKQAA